MTTSVTCFLTVVYEMTHFCHWCLSFCIGPTLEPECEPVSVPKINTDVEISNPLPVSLLWLHPLQKAQISSATNRKHKGHLHISEDRWNRKRKNAFVWVCVKQASSQNKTCKRSGGDIRCVTIFSLELMYGKGAREGTQTAAQSPEKLCQSRWKASKFKSCIRVVLPLVRMSCLGVHHALSPHMGEPSGGLP